MLYKEDIKQLKPLDWFDVCCVVLLAGGILYSPFLYTISLILMVVRVLFIGKRKTKLANFKTHKNILFVLLLIYILNIIGGLWSDDWHHYLFELNHKLPFLIIPLFICAILPINHKGLFVAFLSYLSLLTIGLIVGIVHYFIDPYASSRLLIPTARNISLSENICLAISFMVVFVYNNRKCIKYFLPVIILFTIYLFLAELVTGLITLSVLIICAIIFLINKTNKKTALTSLFIGVVLIVGFGLWFYKQYDNYFSAKEPLIKDTNILTAKGNKYTLPKDDFIENGYYVNNYVCYSELASAWLERTKIDIQTPCCPKADTVCYPMSWVVIRYLNSKGLKKDASGINALSDKDIENIKQGIANVVYTKRFSIRPRLYQTFFEFERYFKTSNVNNMSIIQRLFWSKNAINVIKQNLLIGVGTGDAHQELVAPVKDEHPELCTTFCNPHNAILYILVSFGILGLVVSLLYLFLPAFKLHLFTNPYYCTFFIILCCWMFSESTFESYEGMTFISTFCSLFALTSKKKKIN